MLSVHYVLEGQWLCIQSSYAELRLSGKPKLDRGLVISRRGIVPEFLQWCPKQIRLSSSGVYVVEKIPRLY